MEPRGCNRWQPVASHRRRQGAATTEQEPAPRPVDFAYGQREAASEQNRAVAGDQYFPVPGMRAFADAGLVARADASMHKREGNGLSSESTSKRGRPQYAVAWRVGDGPCASGRLEFTDDALVLHGSAAPEGMRIRFQELSSVEIGRASGERINGDRSVVLERRWGERVLIGALAGVGLLGELVELLVRLRAKHLAQARVAVVAPIKQGGADQARRLVAEGPPFELEPLALQRHHVFVSDREVVFVFEGDNAPATIAALSRNPALLQAALRWRGILAARPRLAEEEFGWARPTPTHGHEIDNP